MSTITQKMPKPLKELALLNTVTAQKIQRHWSSSVGSTIPGVDLLVIDTFGSGEPARFNGWRPKC
jgi:hypothetical protein